MGLFWKILIGVILVTIIGFALTLYQIGDVDVKPITKNEIISFADSEDKLYLSARAWGLAGNHEEIVLSNVKLSDDHKSYSKQNCYIFYTSSIYYKIEDGKNLVVYVNQNSVSEPTNFISDIKIKFKDLKTAKELQDYAENYDKYGLVKVSIFDE